MTALYLVAVVTIAALLAALMGAGVVQQRTGNLGRAGYLPAARPWRHRDCQLRTSAFFPRSPPT
ncbi:hypothetical protein [Bradyrhizobium lablabi]|uniref:hypothetical protein n=1 Tax=Bradyrhizobium lablabi TaxID=722472 RepID=UPI0012E3D4D6|nr:hypothetical protein [Bradyrhizobium lablabi]